MSQIPSGKQVIFFDGVCNLCNGFVDFLVRRDQEGHFLYAPLQGETAKKLLGSDRELRSVVLWSQGEIREKSDAALAVLQQLGFPWPLARVFWCVPGFLRDIVYDLVASNRYSLFGKRNSCRLPSPAEKALFLD
jgi:predicted DCC family thiol-disulfide oxidoreductase YuxK